MPLLAPRVWLLLGLIGAVGSASAAEAVPAEPFRFESLLPLAWQKRPNVAFNAITEMTPAGRRQRVPSPETPLYYTSSMRPFVQAGWQVAAGERPPLAADLEEAMRKALAGNGYLPTTRPDQRPDLLIVFSFGSHGTDPASIAPDNGGSPPVTADELVPIVLTDVALFKDVVERATLIGGEKFARELKSALDGEVNNMKSNASASRVSADTPPPYPVSPDFGSPYQIFVRSGNSRQVAHLAELAFHTCYFVLATAYDFSGVEKKEKILLWRTKMTVEAQGVSMAEILKPLILNTGAFLGRDMPEAATVRKQINREGTVRVGTPTVVEETKPAAVSEPADQR